jgi:hypothetical protein
VLAAVLALSRSAVAAGALLGAAVDVKVSMAIVAAAFAVALWRRPTALLAAAAGLLFVALPSYISAGPHVFDQARTASSFVALSSPWQAVALLADGVTWRHVTTTLAWLAAAALAVVLLRRDRLARAEEADVAVRAAMASAAVLAASVLATACVLPWYDAPLLAVLALLPGSRLDRIVLAHTSLLTVAYLPGNALDLACPCCAACCSSCAESWRRRCSSRCWSRRRDAGALRRRSVRPSDGSSACYPGMRTTATPPAATCIGASCSAPDRMSTPPTGTCAVSFVWFMTKSQLVPSSPWRRTVSTPGAVGTSALTPASAATRPTKPSRLSRSGCVATYHATPAPAALRVMAGTPGSGPSTYVATTSAVVARTFSVHTVAVMEPVSVTA